MPTLLPKKNNQGPLATDDTHHEAMAADPTITQFPQGSTFGGPNAFTTTSNGTSTFGSPSSGGFGPPSSFGSPASSSSAPATNLTAAGSNAAQGADVLVAHDKESSDWINKKWRPVMGWQYMFVCTCDFVIFPVLWSVLQMLSKGNVTTQWQPITLQGAGLYHIAMGAVLGIAAYGRSQEKIAGKS